MVIDCHTHIDEDEIYRSYMKKARKRIDLAFVMHYGADNLTEVSNFVNSKKDLKLIVGIDLEKPSDIEKQLETAEELFRKKEAIGIKLYPGYQPFNAADKRVWPIAELCMKYDRPLAFHSGDVSNSAASLVMAHPIYVDDLAVKYPELKIVICHFGFPFLMEAANVISKNANVYADISGTIDSPETKEDMKLLFNEYSRDLSRILAYFPEIKKKIMFGTDYGGEDTPLDEIDAYIRIVKKVFPKELQSWVFGGLAKKLYLEL